MCIRDSSGAQQRLRPEPEQRQPRDGAQQLVQPDDAVVAQHQRGDQHDRRTEAGRRVDCEGQPEARAEQPAQRGGQRAKRADQCACAGHPQEHMDLTNGRKEHG